MVPIAIFIVVVIAGFQADIFALNFWGGAEQSLSSIAQQVRNTMLVTVFVFVGIEGASVYSRYAKDRNDVGIATVLGFLGVLCLLVLVTVFSYGILLREDLAALATPSMAGVMEAIVGPWGARLYQHRPADLGPGQLPVVVAARRRGAALRRQDNTMPALLAQENRNGVPTAALWLTNLVIQAFLLVTWFAESAFTIALKMTSAMTLVPYLLVAAYACKIAYTGETYGGDAGGRRGDGCAARSPRSMRPAMLYAGGAKFILLAALLYAPGTSSIFSRGASSDSACSRRWR